MDHVCLKRALSANLFAHVLMMIPELENTLLRVT